jgi:hypothetical protein
MYSNNVNPYMQAITPALANAQPPQMQGQMPPPMQPQMQVQPQENAPAPDLNQLSPQALGSALQNYSGNDQNMPTKDRDHKANIFDRIDQATKVYDDFQSGGMDKALGGMMGAKSYANVKPMTDKLASYGNVIGNAAGSAYKSGASSLAGLFK